MVVLFLVVLFFEGCGGKSVKPVLEDGVGDAVVFDLPYKLGGVKNNTSKKVLVSFGNTEISLRPGEARYFKPSCTPEREFILKATAFTRIAKKHGKDAAFQEVGESYSTAFKVDGMNSTYGQDPLDVLVLLKEDNFNHGEKVSWTKAVSLWAYDLFREECVFSVSSPTETQLSSLH
jgi:hypothetical protein